MLLRVLLSGAVLAVSLPSLPAAPDAPLPFDQLEAPESLAIPKVSLDGKRVALRAEIDAIQYLALMDVATLELKLVAKFETTRLLNIFWKGDEFLLLIVKNSNGSSEFRSFDMKIQQTKFLSDGMYFNWARMLCGLPDEPDQVLVEVNSVNGTYLARLNLRNGKLHVVEKNDSSVVSWFVDQKGLPLAALCNERKKISLRWRPAPNAPWQQTELGPEKPRTLYPFDAHPDRRRILAWDHSGAGTTRLIALEPSTLAQEVIFQHPEVSPDEVFAWSDDLAPSVVWYQDDRDRVHPLDPEAGRLQTLIDQSLPERSNLVFSASQDRNVVVFLSSSEQDSGTYYVLDRKERRLSPFGTRYAEHRPEAMGPGQSFTFPSKDGRKIRGHVTFPPGNGTRHPAVLMLGDQLAGPRSRAGFSAQRQIFATRGYAVIQIDTRGTSGFSREFTRAGDYQFATGIVDDLEAGLDFATAQGWIDPTRVALQTQERSGVVGLQALTRSRRFKVWLNERTKFLHPLEPIDLALSEKEGDEVIAELGKEQVKALIKSLDAKNVLPTVTTPSIHFYFREFSHSISQDSRFVRDHLKTSGALREIVDCDTYLDEKKSLADLRVARQRIFDFLAKWMPAQSAP